MLFSIVYISDSRFRENDDSQYQKVKAARHALSNFYDVPRRFLTTRKCRHFRGGGNPRQNQFHFISIKNTASSHGETEF